VSSDDDSTHSTRVSRDSTHSSVCGSIDRSIFFELGFCIDDTLMLFYVRGLKLPVGCYVYGYNSMCYLGWLRLSDERRRDGADGLATMQHANRAMWESSSAE
jgi:hypothetical protein